MLFYNSNVHIYMNGVNLDDEDLFPPSLESKSKMRETIHT